MRKVNFERGKADDAKRSAKSVFSKYFEPVKKAAAYAVLPVFLTLAGCAGKNSDVKNPKDTTAGKVAIEDTHTEMKSNKKNAKTKFGEDIFSRDEIKEYDEVRIDEEGIDFYELVKKADTFEETDYENGSITEAWKTLEPIMLIKKELRKCLDEKCAIPVETGDNIMFIQLTVKGGAISLWVSGVDSEGILLGIELESFAMETAHGHLKLNYDRTVHTVSIKDGKTSSKNAEEARQLVKDLFGFEVLEAKDGKLIVCFSEVVEEAEGIALYKSVEDIWKDTVEYTKELTEEKTETLEIMQEYPEPKNE